MGLDVFSTVLSLYSELSLSAVIGVMSLKLGCGIGTLTIRLLMLTTTSVLDYL